MKILSLLSGTVLFALAATGAQAGDFLSSDNLNVEAKAGTLGLGVEASYKVNENLVLRGGPNMLSLSHEDTISGVKYDADADLLNVGALVDWHPFKNGFRITAGAYLGQDEATLTGTPASNVTIGDTTYTPAEAGTLTSDVSWNDVSPYLGVGYSNAFHSKSRWRWSIEAGAKFNDKPDVTLTSNGTLASNPAFQSDIEKEITDIQNDLEDFRFYPVITVGVSYRF